MKLLILFMLASQAEARVTAKQVEAVNIIIKAADMVGVPRELVLAICWTESSYRLSLKPRLDGVTKSYGLCQVKLKTARHMDALYKHKIEATEERLNEPFINAFYAAKYIKYQLDRYDGSWTHAIDAYNKGRVVSEDSQYVHKVLKALGRVKYEGNH